MSEELGISRELLADIKARVRQAQQRAALSANAEMIRLYWNIGRLITDRQQEEGWGAGVIPRLAIALKNELPEEKGFSERNLKYMMRFACEYSDKAIVQQPVAQLASGDTGSVEVGESDPSSNLQQPVAQLQVTEHEEPAKEAELSPDLADEMEGDDA